jgi:NAD(P)-dependent dehydrogenase (short-subunit alcohol dehydrogenase family)
MEGLPVSGPSVDSRPRMSKTPRFALITGVSSGLGLAMARRLLDEGVEVWGTARDISRVPALPGLRAVALDLGDPTSVAECIQKIRTEAPALDLLVDNAGNGAFFPLESFPPDALDAQWRVLLHGPAELTRAFYADFRERKRGVIVNVTSLAGDYPIPFMSAYSGAKAGLSAFTRTLMLEAAGSGVAVIDFRPGDYDTGFNDAMRGFDAVSRPDAARARDACEAHVKAGPKPERAARDLWRAVSRGRSGVVASGDFWQAGLGPLLARLAPECIIRAYLRNYYGMGA